MCCEVLTATPFTRTFQCRPQLSVTRHGTPFQVEMSVHQWKQELAPTYRLFKVSRHAHTQLQIISSYTQSSSNTLPEAKVAAAAAAAA
jgi:hypothetical protein